MLYFVLKYLFRTGFLVYLSPLVFPFFIKVNSQQLIIIYALMLLLLMEYWVYLHHKRIWDFRISLITGVSVKKLNLFTGSLFIAASLIFLCIGFVVYYFRTASIVSVTVVFDCLILLAFCLLSGIIFAVHIAPKMFHIPSFILRKIVTYSIFSVSFSLLFFLLKMFENNSWYVKLFILIFIIVLWQFYHVIFKKKYFEIHSYD